ncbi:MAG TPA: hypothetical protein VIL34_12530 [Actinopolymorphaceae bacterium]|jgi:hypothetical protein
MEAERQPSASPSPAMADHLARMRAAGAHDAVGVPIGALRAAGRTAHDAAEDLASMKRRASDMDSAADAHREWEFAPALSKAASEWRKHVDDVHASAKDFGEGLSGAADAYHDGEYSGVESINAVNRLLA